MNSRVVLAATLVLTFAAPACAASLTLLPDWFSNQSARKFWMMPDGKTITGVDGNDVFRWSMSTGRTNIGTLPATIGSLPVRATAVSDDGNAIIGYLGNDQFQPLGDFRWTAAGGAVVMPSPAHSPNARAIPTALSSNGAVIVGNEYGPTDPWGFQFGWKGAFRWTADGGCMPLEGVQFAKAISDDGSVVVGSAPFGETGAQAVRWTPATGSIGLGVLPDSWQRVSNAEFVSTDGATIVGYGFPPDARIGPKIFRWTEAGGMQQTSTLGDDQSPFAISADANAILGGMRTLIPDAGTFATTFDFFLWTPDAGLRTLREIISSLDLNDVYPLSDGNKGIHIFNISGDGRIAFGASLRYVYENDPYIPVIYPEYWLLDLSPAPEPSTISMAFLALLPIARSFCRRNAPTWSTLHE